MADHHLAPESRQRHLDASGDREVVFCHQCENEWFRDSESLICPRCEGEITELVTPESDPRLELNEPALPPGFRNLQHHYPWESGDSDLEEADIEEHITHGPGGSIRISQTIRSSSSRQHGGPFGGRRRRENPLGEPDTAAVLSDFQTMLGNLVGAGNVRSSPMGRSGHETLFTGGPINGSYRAFGMGGGGGPGPSVVGGRFTFTTGGPLRPRNADGPQPEGQPVDDLASILESIFRPISGVGPHNHDHPNPHARGGMPPGLQDFFAAMLNPANARSGDAVYSQEALDQIISTLMEQHPTSNAPGPASPDAIAALPKKALDEKMLGPEGKGECSVCMDDVYTGDEVVVLPCSHWFHETCAGAWLGEHNTCPICRKGIEGEPAPTTSRRSSQNQTNSPTSRPEHRVRRVSSIRPRLSRDNTSSSRNEARLDYIRSSARLPPTDDDPLRNTSTNTPPTMRFQIVGTPNITTTSPSDPNVSRRGSRRHSTIVSSSSPSNWYERRDSRRDSRVGNTSGSDHSRESRRSSVSAGRREASSSSGGGPLSWLRDRFGGSNHNHRHDST